MATPTTGTLHEGATGDGTGRGLQAHALTKYLGGTAVLQDFSLSIAPGEVHGLVGENGSGKSTFIKILSGYHIPEPGGAVLVDGARLRLGSPASSYELGCRFVHQDLGLIETSTVMDNLNFSKGFATRLGTIRRGSLRREAARDLARIGLDLDPRQDVGSLSAASRDRRCDRAGAQRRSPIPSQSARSRRADRHTSHYGGSASPGDDQNGRRIRRGRSLCDAPN